MLNTITIMGRLTRDPELRRLDNGKAVVNVSIACERDFAPKNGGERETDFIDIVIFGSTAEFFSKYFAKGSMAIVSGRLQIRTWTDKDGNKRRNAEVIADSVYFGDSKKSSTGTSTYEPTNSYQESSDDYSETQEYIRKYMEKKALQSDFEMLDDDDMQLPF